MTLHPSSVIQGIILMYSPFQNIVGDNLLLLVVWKYHRSWFSEQKDRTQQNSGLALATRTETMLFCTLSAAIDERAVNVPAIDTLNWLLWMYIYIWRVTHRCRHRAYTHVQVVRAAYILLNVPYSHNCFIIVFHLLDACALKYIMFHILYIIQWVRYWLHYANLTKLALFMVWKHSKVFCNHKWVLNDFSLIAVESMTSRSYCLSHMRRVLCIWMLNLL